ncbi:MAG: DUF928 domain-containing protein [Leptolyngbyaceae cyanobacterium]
MTKPLVFLFNAPVWSQRSSLGLPLIVCLGLSLTTVVAKVPPTAIAQATGKPLRTPLINDPLSDGAMAEISTSVRFNPPPPPDRGAPVGRSRGGGVRSGCGLDETTPALTALMPVYELAVIPDHESGDSPSSDDQVVESVWSYTTQDYPTFWFYLPHELAGKTEVLFVLQEQLTLERQAPERQTPERQTPEGQALNAEPETILNTLHIETFYPTTSPGLVRITIPDAIAPLAVGRDYKWSFQVYCQANPDDPDFVEGWIYRIDLDRESVAQFQTATPEEQVQIYASGGIWQDALAISMQQLLEQEVIDSEDRRGMAEWRSLLDSVGLGDLVNQPFADCCGLDEE